MGANRKLKRQGFFREPPRPSRTLAQLRQQDEVAWRVFQQMLDRWIHEVFPESVPVAFCNALLPGAVNGDIAGEQKLEAIEHLLDTGYLRAVITNEDDGDAITFRIELWTGRGYRPVGRRTL